MKKLDFLNLYHDHGYWAIVVPEVSIPGYITPNRTIPRYFFRLVSNWSPGIWTVEILISKDESLYIGF